MPNRALNNADSFENLKGWLNDNLIGVPPIPPFTPHQDLIPEIPNEKGIYFWFMHNPKGYKELSEHVEITQINSIFSIEINGVIYDLIYLGTAGTGRNGNSHLQERLNWHITQKHTEGAICSGTLSTLRAGLGALLSDDLILPRTEQVVNEFMEKYLKVFWIEYPDDKSLIDNDEKILIKVVRPLLNLKNNPNARANTIANATQVYKIRRAEVYKNTRLGLGCKGESDKSKKENKTPTKDAPSFEHQVYSIENGCVEFFVLKNQSILDVARGIKGLPEEACTFQILNSNTGLLVSEFKGWNTTGTKVHINPKAQNIYTYFSAPGGKIEGKETARWIHIQNRMNKKNNEIDEITVKVCSSKKNVENKTNNYRNESVKTHNTDMEIEKLLNSLESKNLKVKKTPKLLIIGCCNAKSIQPNNLQNGNIINYSFGNAIDNSRANRLDFYTALAANHFVNRPNGGQQYYIEALNNECRREALDVYGSNRSPFYKPLMKDLYREKINDCNLHLLIVSGLYGIIRHNDYINDYHLEITTGPNIWGNEINNAVSAYMEVNNIDEDAVFYSLSGNYLPFLNPLPQWNNLWLNHPGHGHNQANDLMIFLNNIC